MLVDSTQLNLVNSTASRYRKYLPYLICVLAGFFYAFEMLQMSLGSTLSTVLIKNYNFSINQLQLFSSIYLYSCAVAIIPAGILFDRLPPKPLLITSLIICLGGLLITALAKTPFLLIMGRALIGLSSDFSFLGYFILIDIYFKNKKQVWINSLVYTWGAAGCLISQAPLNLLINFYGMSQALLMMFGIGLILLVGFFFFIENSSPNLENSTPKLSVLQTIKQVLFNKVNLVCAFYSSVTNLPLVILGALYGKLYLIKVLNLSPINASSLNSLIFLGALIGSPIIGYLALKAKIPHLMRAIALVAAVCWTSLACLGNYIWVVAIIFFSFGILINAQLLSVITVGKTNSKKLLATSLSILSITNNAGGGFYQLIASSLLLFYAPTDCISETCVYNTTAFNHLFLLIALLYLISGLFSYSLLAKQDIT